MPAPLADVHDSAAHDVGKMLLAGIAISARREKRISLVPLQTGTPPDFPLVGDAKMWRKLG